MRIQVFQKLIFRFLGTVYFKKGWKYPILVADMNEYNIQTLNKGRTRWTCRNYKKSKCNSIVYTYGKTVKILRHHNHAPTIERLDDPELISQKVNIIREEGRVVKRVNVDFLIEKLD
ncbi:unnamed protein product [Psylliodes chrysocephalus]|uniref:FLYWCH-type domain-containing protein n=1 Tax=Psylliodes chrysocephalus TaxID=3402493 RepID=A0A9P0CFF4_9CUCU|nr:unnamed protein product [Psylliodes chrysocephala]